MTLQRTAIDAPRCGNCLFGKLRAVDAVTCFNEALPYYGATLSRFDHCERHEPRVIVVTEAPRDTTS